MVARPAAHGDPWPEAPLRSWDCPLAGELLPGVLEEARAKAEPLLALAFLLAAFPARPVALGVWMMGLAAVVL